jgi:hypothetical protein
LVKYNRHHLAVNIGSVWGKNPPRGIGKDIAV